MRSGAGVAGAVLGSLLGVLIAGGVIATPVASATNRLAYVSPPGLPYSALSAVDADGTHRLKLLGGFHVIGAPVWSPDGTRLAVPTCRKDTGSCPGNAAWSPDGRFIAYISVAGVDRISVKRTDGSHLHVFDWSDDDEAAPRWLSPRLLAYEQTHNGGNGTTGPTSLRTVDIRTRNTRIVVPNGVVDEDWSPIRHQFVIARGPSSPSDALKDIWLVNADGTGLRRLTSTGNADRPVWSPDGTAIAVTTLDWDYVWTLILGKGKPRTVAIGYGWSAAWQPQPR